MDQMYDITDYDAAPELLHAATTSTTEMTETAEEPVDWPKVVSSILICVIGLVGNAVVIFVIAALREYRKSVIYWYVLQLAIADSMFLLSLPFKAIEDINNEWIFPEWLCKTNETVLFLTYFASVMTLMTMSIDRYIAVCSSFSDRLQSLHKQRAAMIITAVTWIISVCLCAPIMMYSTVAGTLPHCRCSYVFPASSTIYDSNNVTEICLSEGFGETELDWCIQMNTRLRAEYDVMQHCHNISSDPDFFNISGFEHYGNYHDGMTNLSLGSEEQLNNTMDMDYFDDYMIDNSTAHASDQIAMDCVYEMTSTIWRSFLIFNFTVLYVLPVVVMAICYGLIVRRLFAADMRSSSVSHSSPQASHQDSERIVRTSASNGDRKRITIMSASLVVCFIVFWLPFHVGHLAKLVGIPLPEEKGYICRNLTKAGSVMAYVNSAINPFLYSILGTNFIGRLRAACRKLKRGAMKATTSISDEMAVRYSRRKRRNRGDSSSHTTGTVETKIYKGRIATKDNKQSMDSSDVMFVTDTHQPAASLVPASDVLSAEPQANHDETSLLKQ